MFIEATFMRYGKGPGGIVGATLQPNINIEKLINTQILKNLDNMREKSRPKPQEFQRKSKREKKRQ